MRPGEMEARLSAPAAERPRATEARPRLLRRAARGDGFLLLLLQFVLGVEAGMGGAGSPIPFVGLLLHLLAGALLLGSGGEDLDGFLVLSSIRALRAAASALPVTTTVFNAGSATTDTTPATRGISHRLLSSCLRREEAERERERSKIGGGRTRHAVDGLADLLGAAGAMQHHAQHHRLRPVRRRRRRRRLVLFSGSLGMDL